MFRNEVVPHTVSSVNNKRSKRWSQHLYSFRVATMVHIKTYARVMKRWRRYWSTSTAVTFLPLCLHRAWWEYVHSVPIYIWYIYRKYARSSCTRSDNVIQLGTIASKWIFCVQITNDEIHSILIVFINDLLERDLKIHSSTAFCFVRSSSSAVRSFTFFVWWYGK